MGGLFDAIIHDDELNESGDFPNLLSEGMYCPKEVFRGLRKGFSSKGQPAGIIKSILRDDKNRLKIRVESKLDLEDKGIGIGLIIEEERLINGIKYITKAQIIDFSLVDNPVHDNYRFRRLSIQ